MCFLVFRQSRRLKFALFLFPFMTICSFAQLIEYNYIFSKNIGPFTQGQADALNLYSIINSILCLVSPFTYFVLKKFIIVPKNIRKSTTANRTSKLKKQVQSQGNANEIEWKPETELGREREKSMGSIHSTRNYSLCVIIAICEIALIVPLLLTVEALKNFNFGVLQSNIPQTREFFKNDMKSYAMDTLMRNEYKEIPNFLIYLQSIKGTCCDIQKYENLKKVADKLNKTELPPDFCEKSTSKCSGDYSIDKMSYIHDINNQLTLNCLLNCIEQDIDGRIQKILILHCEALPFTTAFCTFLLLIIFNITLFAYHMTETKVYKILRQVKYCDDSEFYDTDESETDEKKREDLFKKLVTNENDFY